MIFSEALKKRGVGMVVGAPSRCTRYTHASDGSAWSSGERGSIAEARFEPKQVGTVNSNPNGFWRIARFIQLSGKLATMAPHSGRSCVLIRSMRPLLEQNNCLMSPCCYSSCSIANASSAVGDASLQHRSPVFCAGSPPGGCVFSNPLRKMNLDYPKMHRSALMIGSHCLIMLGLSQHGLTAG